MQVLSAEERLVLSYVPVETDVEYLYGDFAEQMIERRFCRSIFEFCEILYHLEKKGFIEKCNDIIRMTNTQPSTTNCHNEFATL
ncbi:MAG: hypothetical protein ACRCY4_04510 [Brevinema sp.]